MLLIMNLELSCLSASFSECKDRSQRMEWRYRKEALVVVLKRVPPYARPLVVLALIELLVC